MDEEALRDTEAKVFLGENAHEMGLVDDLGTREELEERVKERIGADVETTELEPATSVAERLRSGAERVAYAFGAGIASRFADADGEFSFRV